MLTLADEVRARDDEWSKDTELLVGVFEMLQLIRREQLAGIGVKRQDLPEFHRVPRPGDPPPRPRTVSPREAFALMMGGV